MKVAKRLELGVTFKSPLRVAVRADLSYKRIENLINAKKPRLIYINPVLFIIMSVTAQLKKVLPMRDYW